MSNDDQQLLELMSDHPLFQPEYIVDNFRRFSDQELEKQLASYRDYCLRVSGTRCRAGQRNLSVLTEGMDSLPSATLLRQCALYVDDVVIKDPVFELSRPRNTISDAFGAVAGFEPQPLPRETLVRSVTYMNGLRSTIGAGFVRFLPISRLHEPPDNLPMRYSENLFSDVLPQDLLAWFWTSAEVHTLKREDRGWTITDELVPCRAIATHFKGDLPDRIDLRFLYEAKILSLDETKRTAGFSFTLPDDVPDDAYFLNWVCQSVNQAARGVFNSVYKEVQYARDVRATYLTRSPFVADLLAKDVSKTHDLKTGVLKSVLKLQLPILEGVSLDRVIEIRQQEGEAFQNFRVDLEKRLRDLRRISDADELALKIEDVAHEVSEVQVTEIDRKIKSLKNKRNSSAAISIASLAATIVTHGFSLVAAAGAASEGLKAHNEFKSQEKENPAYFLWRIQRSKSE